MRTVDDFAQIRQFHRDGRSGREIARELGCGRETVRKALRQAEPSPYSLAVPRAAPKFGCFTGIVDAILKSDESAPLKQRHTGTRIYRRLVAEHGYPGGYDQVRRYLQSRRQAARETFIPLAHPPGHRAEADFGHIHVDFPDGRRLVPVLVVTWSYSNAPFAVALPDSLSLEDRQNFCGCNEGRWRRVLSGTSVESACGRSCLAAMAGCPRSDSPSDASPKLGSRP